MKGVFPLPPDWFQDRYIYLPKSGHLISIQTERPVGYLTPNGYLVLTIGKTAYPVHRVIWAIKTGRWPIEVDHINHNRADNRWDNLRECDSKENQRNKSLQKNNTSGVTGVYWNEKSKSWLASITVNNQRVHVGIFTHKEDAIKARKQAEIEYGFHSNHGIKKEDN